MMIFSAFLLEGYGDESYYISSLNFNLLTKGIIRLETNCQKATKRVESLILSFLLYFQM